MWMTSLCLALNTTPFILVVCVYVRIPDPSLSEPSQCWRKANKTAQPWKHLRQRTILLCFFSSDST